MPTILVRDPTLLERLNKLKPMPSDYYDDVLYELLKRAESANRPAIRGLDNLPQMVEEAVRKALDSRLVELVKSALLPNMANLTLEVPVVLSIRVKLRFEPVFDVTPDTPTADDVSSSNGATGKGGDNPIEELERRAIEILKQHGGCWEGSAYALAKYVAGDVNWALEKRLKRRLVKVDSRLCLPEAVAQA